MRKIFFYFILIFLISFQVQAWTACGMDGQGNIANCEYEINDGTLRIRGIGDDGNIGYWHDASEWRYIAPWGSQEFQDVIIENSIKNLGSYGFVGVTSVNPIQIPSSVEAISYASFQQVTAPEVLIPDSVSFIDGVAFYDADIQKINVPDSVTSMSWGFRGSQFTDIVLPDTMESIGGDAFSDCQNLKSITIGENTNFGENNMFLFEDTDISQLQIYCTGDTQKCDANLETAGYPNLKSVAVQTEKKDGKTYVYDMNGHLLAISGKNQMADLNTAEPESVATPEPSSGTQTETSNTNGNFTAERGKRIYTVKEANEAAGKKNKLMIRYR